MGFPLLEIATNEVENELYRANGGNRCYFCKTTLFDSMSLLKQERGIPEGGLGEGFTELRMMYDPAWVEKRPEIKVSDDYDNYEDITSKAKPEEEAPPEEEDTSSDETAGKGKEEKPDTGSDATASGGGAEEEEAPKSADDLSKEIDSIGKEAGA
jgi:hypothetical protein